MSPSISIKNGVSPIAKRHFHRRASRICSGTVFFYKPSVTIISIAHELPVDLAHKQ